MSLTILTHTHTERERERGKSHSRDKKWRQIVQELEQILDNLKIAKGELELKVEFQQERWQEAERKLIREIKNNKHLNYLVNQQIIFHQNHQEQVKKDKQNLQTKNDNLEQTNETSQHKFQKVRVEAKKWKQKTQANQEKLANSQTTIFTLEQQLAAEKKAHRQTKQKLESKEQKITDLTNQLAEKDRIIAELRNKPPVQPANSPNKSEKNPELDIFLTEKAQLLNTIQQKEAVIRQLKIKLQQATNQPPKIKQIIKEIPVENLTVIQGLQTELRNKDKSLIQLRYYSMLISGISVLLLICLARLLKKKNKKTKDNKH